jgi:hypothetical protein
MARPVCISTRLVPRHLGRAFAHNAPMNTSKANLSIARVAGGGFILVGSLIAIAGLIWLTRTAWFSLHAAKAAGVVVAMERSESSEGGSTFHPVFTFTDGAGIIHTQRASFGSSTYSFESGERVTVLYDPAVPKHSKIDSFQTVWLGPLLITGFGLLFGGFACFWLFLAARGIRLQQTPEGEQDGLSQ